MTMPSDAVTAPSKGLILITGGAGDIGWATCLAARMEGHPVVCADLPMALDARREEIAADGGISTQGMDIASPEAVASAIEQIERTNGEIAGFAHCAAIAQVKPVLDLTAEEWRRMMSINLDGAFWCAQAVSRRMVARGHGRVVLLTSVAGKVGGLQVGAHYAASKAGVISLVFSLAKALASNGVLVNGVAPGIIRTRMTDAFSDEVHALYAAQVPLGRYGTAAEVAQAVLWLLSDQNSYITGEVLDVNGGLLVD